MVLFNSHITSCIMFSPKPHIHYPFNLFLSSITYLQPFTGFNISNNYHSAIVHILYLHTHSPRYRFPDIFPFTNPRFSSFWITTVHITRSRVLAYSRACPQICKRYTPRPLARINHRYTNLNPTTPFATYFCHPSHP